MTAVAAKYHPLPTLLQFHGRAQVARHVTRRVEDPEAPVSKEVEGALKGRKRDPVALEFRPPLRDVLWTAKVPTVPLHLRVRLATREVAWRAKVLCAGAKVRFCVGELVAYGPAVVKVGVAVDVVAFVSAVYGQGLELQSWQNEPEDDGINVVGVDA